MYSKIPIDVCCNDPEVRRAAEFAAIVGQIALSVESITPEF
jgi:hypothetical protein